MKENQFKIALSVVISCVVLHCAAQKLPVVQQGNQRAPDHVKIDGKLTEWGNLFKAFNKPAGIYYTVANDDEMLYLTIQATDVEVIEKITKGGITLTVNAANKKQDKDAKTVSYPAYDKKEKPLFLVINKPPLVRDTIKNRMHADSMMSVFNQQIVSKFKLIKLTGIPDIADNMLSVYNEEGIKANAQFDSRIYFNYELAIPLKYLGLTEYPGIFFYNIKLNDAAAYAAVVKVDPNREAVNYTDNAVADYSVGQASAQNMKLLVSTDFWGEYTLAKKP